MTTVLAAMGTRERARAQPWLPLLLTAKLGFDVYQSLRLTVEQWTRFRAFCSWCLLASAATSLTAPLVVPEARAAVRALWRRR